MCEKERERERDREKKGEIIREENEDTTVPNR